MKTPQIVTDLWGVQEYLTKVIKGGNLEAKKGRTTILHATHRLYLYSFL